MKKSLFIFSLMTLFACNRESENLGVTEIPGSSSKTASHRSGDIGAIIIDFLPSNLACETGEGISPIDTLPNGLSGVNATVKIKAKYNPLLTKAMSLPELILNYFNYQGIAVQQVLYNNSTPPSGSYFTNNSFKEFTFSERITTIPEDNGTVATFSIFNFDDYMDNDDASIIVQNAYDKIVNNHANLMKNNKIKAIRFFYEDDYTCSDLQEKRRNLKIQVIYKLDFATQIPVLEP